jgi:hypothetical protein
MKNKLLRLIIVVCLSGMALSLTAWAIASTAQQENLTTQADRTTRAPADLDHVPIVDLENSAPSAAEADPQTRAARSVKGERYARHVKGFIVDRDIPGGMSLTFRYIEPLPAFPVRGSAIIALGEVVDARAYLSDDQTGVYSEFSIRIDEVFKNDPLQPGVPGSLVVAERFGGRVRFLSGRVIFYGYREQGMPQQGRRYVFFLNRADQQYSLLTAYELLAGRVYPLDGRNAPGGKGAFSVGDEYENTDANRFLAELQKVLIEYSRTPLEKEMLKP